MNPLKESVLVDGRNEGGTYQMVVLPFPSVLIHSTPGLVDPPVCCNAYEDLKRNRKRGQ